MVSTPKELVLTLGSLMSFPCLSLYEISGSLQISFVNGGFRSTFTDLSHKDSKLIMWTGTELVCFDR